MTSTMERMEQFRAEAIRDVCLRDGLTETETIDYFKAMMVSDALTSEVTGLDPSQRVFTRRLNPQETLAAWCAENVGKTMSVPMIAEGMGLSEQTARKRMKETPGAFLKAEGLRGFYEVQDFVADRAAAKASA